jgi:uncharacterized protein
MFRYKIAELNYWKEKKNRKPLILNGARQVGKSWLIKDFAKKAFTEDIIELNFEKNLEYHKIFTQNLSVKRIINEISLIIGKKIVTGQQLLFFDEIQMCPEALVSLRYFYEEMPELHVIAAGSLLDFTFRKIPFPVGRVEFNTLHPMTFLEFLIARNKSLIADTIQKNEAISETIDNLIYDELQNYFVVGGMPECVKLFCENENLNEIQALQNDLMYAFRQDFQKYKPVVNTDCLLDILENSVANIGNQTQYSKLSERFTNPTIKQGHTVLCTARILNKVDNVGVSGLPITRSGKQFKSYFLDIGLLLSLSKIDFKTAYLNKNLLATFEGRLAEQFVAQQLIATNTDLYYWARTESGANAEVDFVVVEKGQIIPIEVKAGKSGALKSLHYLLQKYPNITKARIYGRFREGNQDKLNFVPIYKAGV